MLLVSICHIHMPYYYYYIGYIYYRYIGAAAFCRIVGMAALFLYVVRAYYYYYIEHIIFQFGNFLITVSLGKVIGQLISCFLFIFCLWVS